MTDDEIRDLAARLYRGEIFTSAQIASHDIGMISLIFMPLAMMTKEQLDKMREEKPHLLWAPMSTACPRSVNGYPMLTEVHWLSREDAERLFDRYNAIKKAVEG